MHMLLTRPCTHTSPPPHTHTHAQAVVAKLVQYYGPSSVRLLTRPCKLGLGSAYAHGLKAARADLVLLMDADLSHHPKYIPHFLRIMVRARGAVGCRPGQWGVGVRGLGR